MALTHCAAPPQCQCAAGLRWQRSGVGAGVHRWGMHGWYPPCTLARTDRYSQSGRLIAEAEPDRLRNRRLASLKLLS